MFADNFSPMQRLAIEVFEDSRIEALILRAYPGLRRIFLALHPTPRAGACDPETTSCLRHRLAMLSRALLDAEHGYQDAELLEFVRRFHETMAQGESSSEAIAELALAYIARTRRQSDQLANIHFADTEVGYRDDNRHLWRFHELSDDEEMFDEQRPTTVAAEVDRLPPRHYPSGTTRARATGRTGSASTNRCIRRVTPGISTACSKSTPPGPAPEASAGSPQAAGQGPHPLPGRRQRTRPRHRHPFADRLQGRRQPDPRINMSHRTTGATWRCCSCSTSRSRWPTRSRSAPTAASRAFSN
jgi:uncharacterized protein YoaH (UPF0181 family)